MLEGCCKFQNVTVVPGDVLVVRTGWIEALLEHPEEVRSSKMAQCTGVSREVAILKWHWEHGVAAVASDV